MTTKAIHVLYLSLFAVSLLIGSVFLREHDERIISEANYKSAQDAIHSLQEQKKTSDDTFTRQTNAIHTAALRVHTPQQAIRAIPDVTNLPFRSIGTSVSVEAVPFYQAMAACKEQYVQLQQCQSDLGFEYKISGEQQKQIIILKKKPKFMHRVLSVVKYVAIGMGVGLLIAK
jgi:hypothetical protein